jgi:hypothetical protein
VWEDDRFIGVVIFSRGPSPYIGDLFGLSQIQVCELTRVALREHATPVTRIVAIALKLLRRSNPGLKLVVSYADPERNHRGGIYQGGNWIFIGTSIPVPYFQIAGKIIHNRTVNVAVKSIRRGNRMEKIREHFKTDDVVSIAHAALFKYVYPLDPSMLPVVERMRKPYPKEGERARLVQVAADKRGGSIVSDVPGLPSGRGRVDSTPPLRAHPKRPKRISK